MKYSVLIRGENSEDFTASQMISVSSGLQIFEDITFIANNRFQVGVITSFQSHSAVLLYSL